GRWRRAPRCRGSLGQGVGEAAQVVHEQVGLLQGGEVAAFVELRPPHDVREGPVGQPPDRQDDVAWGDRYSQWHRQRRQGRGGPEEGGGVVVQLRGRPGGSGQPVDRRVGEQQVAVDRVLGELV